MTDLIIREYKAADKPVLLEILKLNIPDYFAESELADYEEYLDHRIERYFVAETGGRVIGAGGINCEADTGMGKISWDFVDPHYRGKGVGKKLLDHRIALLRSMPEVRRITVRTSQLAYVFYEKNGFSLKKVTANYWAEGLDLYEMEYK